MHLMTCSLPGDSSPVGRLLLFKENLAAESWTYVKRVFRFVKMFFSHWICFHGQRSSLKLIKECDAAQAGCYVGRASTYRYVFMIARAHPVEIRNVVFRCNNYSWSWFLGAQHGTASEGLDGKYFCFYYWDRTFSITFLLFNHRVATTRQKVTVAGL